MELTVAVIQACLVATAIDTPLVQHNSLYW
jgi:hypothetical protein